MWGRSGTEPGGVLCAQGQRESDNGTIKLRRGSCCLRESGVEMGQPLKQCSEGRNGRGEGSGWGFLIDVGW